MLPVPSINELIFPDVVSSPASAQPSEIECAVMNLFEDFRNPLLRYVLSFGLPVHLRGWIFRVAHNLALKQRYSNQRSRDSTSSDWAIAEKQLDPSPNAEEQVLFTQRRRRLLAVLRVLPEDDQCCLRLRAEGLRYREIASVLGISLGAVSISLTRSLARLLRADGC
jgi:RNA polymerase sigma-70 factor (ECF subfamily)